MQFKISAQQWTVGLDNSDSDKFKISAGSTFTTTDFQLDTSGRLGIGTAPVAGYSITTGGKMKSSLAMVVSGVETGNPQPAANHAHLSGYGIIGNRGTFYVTNNGTVQIGNGTTHNANPAASFTSSSVSLYRSTNLTSSDYIDLKINQTDSAAIKMGVSSATTEGFIMTDTTGGSHLSTDPVLKFLYNDGTTAEYARFTTSGLDVTGRLDVASDLRIRGNSSNNDLGVVRFYADNGNHLYIDTGNNGSQIAKFAADGSLTLSSSATQGLTIKQSADLGADMQVEIRGSRNAPGVGVNPAKLILSSYDNDDGSGVVKTGAEFYMESTSLTGANLTDFEVGLRYRKDGSVIDGLSIHDGEVKAHGYLTVTGGEINIPSGAKIDWANGDARIIEGDVSNYSLSFQTWTGSALTTKMFISSGGNIGIGTTSPSAQLQIDTPSANQAGQGLRLNRPSAGTNYHSVEFATNGTVDWSVGQNSNDAFEVYENGLAASTRFTIKEGGNVGIGTTDPKQKLHVDGNIYLGPNNTNNFIHSGAALGLQADGDIKIVSDVNDTSGVGASDIIFGYGSSTNTDSNPDFTESELGTYPRVELMRLDVSTDRVGIGTNAPAEKLDVAGTARMDTGITEGTHYVGTSIAHWGDGDTNIAFSNDDITFKAGDVVMLTINENGTQDKVVVNGNGGDVDFRVEGDTDENLLFTDASTDRVGVGTSSPATKLHLYEASAAPVLLTLHNYQSDINPNGTQGNFIDFKMTDGNPTFTPQARIGMLVKDSDGDGGMPSEGSGHFVVYTGEGSDNNGNGTLSEHFRITDKGSVGIGTSTPSTKLHVSGGNILVDAQYGIRFVDANTRIYTNSDSPEDLIVEADQNLHLNPDGSILAQSSISMEGGSIITTDSNNALVLRSDVQHGQGDEDAVISFKQSTTEHAKIDQGGYMYATGFKTTTAATGFLKADGTVDTTTLGTMASADTGDYKDSDTVESYVATELTSYTPTSSFGTNAFTSYTDHSTQGYLTALPSHNHDDIYYTETELEGFFKSITHQGNYISTADWSLDGSGSVDNGWSAEGFPFNPTASFSANGSSSENNRILQELPNGAYGVVWRTPSNDASSDADGGWDMDIYNVHHSKAYRSVVYFQVTDDSTSGTFYHGCHGSHTLNLSGTANTNPYFHTQGFANLVQGRWYVSVGYIQPYQYPTGTNSTRSGIYDCYTGKKVVAGQDYMMKSGSTTQRHRTYQYYSTDTNSSINWWNPRFEELNGNEPSIAELIQRVSIDGELGLNFHSKFPAGALDSLTEATDATNDKILLWDESADVWKQMTLEDLQDSIDQNTTYSVATTSANGLMSSDDKTKLDGVATGADVTPSWVPASDPSYLTSYTETDTLDTVADRGATTNQTLTVGGLTTGGTVTADVVSVTNDATDTFRHRMSVYDSSGGVSYGMMLWNANGTSGDWGTMIYGPNQSNRRISFGKVNTTTPTNHSHVSEIAHFDLDNSSLNLTGDLNVDGGDVKITKQNDAPTLTLLHDGTNPSTNDLLFKMQFQSDYDGTHQNWGKIQVETNSSSVRTDMDFYVKSTSGSEQLGLRIAGQPSETPKAFFYNDVDIDGDVTADNLNVSNWDTAYGWGNHASAGYLTSYTETDTLDSVADRGATTDRAITTGGITATYGYFGSTASNPQVRIFTENASASIADTFTDTTTDKSYIYFQAGTNSNDPGYIMHETSENASPDERNEGVLHLVPSDDNSTGDYVSIHGTNDPDCIKLHTSGLIETSSSYQLTLRSGSGNLRIDDDVEVNQYIRHYGDSDTYISFEDNRVKIVAGNTVKFDSDTIYTGTVQSVTGTGTVSGLTLTDDGDSVDPTLTLGGSITTPVSGDWWNDGFAKVQTDGVMEIGKYIDFHDSDTETDDFSYRLTASNTALTFSGAINIPEYIYHNGDSNTYIRFTGDRIRIVAGGTTKFDSNSTYLTSEADTLATVTGRGASTTTALSVRNVTSRNIVPESDRTYDLGSEETRWAIVYCETLDSAGQHESNLQDEEQPISQYKTGTVLSWKDGKNRPCTQYADHMRMGIAVEGQDSPLIQGAEPVLVTGVVEEGDYLVTSEKEGHAVAVPRNIVKEQMLFDCVIGKALESGDGDSHLIKTWINI
jgi:hypothetical protein